MRHRRTPRDSPGSRRTRRANQQRGRARGRGARQQPRIRRPRRDRHRGWRCSKQHDSRVRRDSVERALLLATLCNELSDGPLERRQALGEEATAVARRIGDPATLVHVLYTVFVTARNVPSLQEQHLQASHEALELAESLGDPVHLFWAATGRHMTAMQNGDFVNATRRLAIEKSPAAVSVSRPCCGSPRFTRPPTPRSPATPIGRRRWPLWRCRSGTKAASPTPSLLGAQLIVTRLHQGRLGELIALVSDVVAQNPGLAGFHAGRVRPPRRRQRRRSDPPS